jgi:exodeoxyribonuclease-5
MLRNRAQTEPICLSSQQQEALDRIERWFDSDNRKPFYYLAGYAGVGKTTLAKSVARRIGGTVLYGAFTGKAAAVMRSKGCEGADTIDSLIYHPLLQVSCSDDPPCSSPCTEPCRFRRERHVGRELNPRSAVVDADAVIIDEVSTVGLEMATDLLSFKVPILVLGDPAQLPPIGDAGYFTNRTPDFLLTEIHRQAFGSPIITLATEVRNQRRLRRGQYGESAVVSDGDLTVDEALQFDQVIVGRHVTRCAINRAVRKALGYRGALPELGEKLICLKNARAKGLRNGTIWQVQAIHDEARGFVSMTVVDDGKRLVDVNAPIDGFALHDGGGADLPGDVFTFGYAVTAHKAQGSQWDSVAVIDESFCFREHRFSWLYTAITRAAQKVTVVL